MSSDVVAAPSQDDADGGLRAPVVADEAYAGELTREQSFAELLAPAGAVDQTAAVVGVPTTGVRAHRRFADWSRRYTGALVAMDALIAVVAVLLTTRFYPPASYFSADKMVVLLLGASVAWPLMITLSHGYDHRKIGVGDDELRAVIRAVVLSIAVGAVPSAGTNKYGLLALSVIAIPAAGVLSVLGRFAARKYLHQRQRTGRNLRRVVLVGSPDSVSDLRHVLEREQHHGMEVVGVCVSDVAAARAELTGVEVLGDLGSVASVVRVLGADAVAVTGGEATRQNYLRELSWALEGVAVELLVHPGLIEVAGPRMHIRPHVGLPLLHIEQPHFTGWRRLVKRGVDLAMTSLGLLAVSPLLLAVAAAIKLDGGGPVLFKQHRVGLDGSTFTMWKFRSMYVDAEQRLADLRRTNPAIGLMFKMTDDPRVTRVGRFLRKFSLDELPQLFNVLTGSMSLVGPRPPLQSEVDAYETHAHRRLLVTPGLTGLWQVSGRSLLSWEETVRLDLRYVENWTLTLDLLILWKTFFAVLARRGAY